MLWLGALHFSSVGSRGPSAWPFLSTPCPLIWLAEKVEVLPSEPAGTDEFALSTPPLFHTASNEAL